MYCAIHVIYKDYVREDIKCQKLYIHDIKCLQIWQANITLKQIIITHSLQTSCWKRLWENHHMQRLFFLHCLDYLESKRIAHCSSFTVCNTVAMEWQMKTTDENLVSFESFLFDISMSCVFMYICVFTFMIL